MKIINHTIKGQHLISLGRIFLLLTFIATTNLSAQNQLISIPAARMTLKEAFAEIEKQASMTIAYNGQIIDVNRKVEAGIKDKSVAQTLDILLSGSGTTYKIQGRQIIIIKETPQQSAVRYTGIVSDASGAPVYGATVYAKGTGQGIITQADGVFSITAPPGTMLNVSYIGYQTQEIILGGRTYLEIVMNEDITQLGDVVVIGYGVQNRRDVSTSISSMNSDQLSNLPISDFRQAMAGKMPGVMVMQPSGDPEGSVSIRVRGISTVNAGSEPLYVIDGIPVERGFANLNNNDIESIEVLKDAASAAIYGSRGSNGVVLVTTKQGRSDKLTVQWDSYVGLQTVSKTLDMLNAYQYAEFAKAGHDGAYMDEVPGASPDDPNSVRPQTYHRIPTELFAYLDGEPGLTDTDWQDAIFRTAVMQSHNISFAGKTNSVNYFISGNYTKRDGIIIASDFEKYTLRLNLDGKYKKLSYGVNFSPSYSKSNRVDASGANGIVQSALMMPPVWPVYNEDGSYNYQGNGYWRIGTDYQHNAVLNPVAQAYLQSDVVDRVAMVGKVYAEYEFIKGLTYNISLGGDFYGAHNDKFRSSQLPLLGHAYYDQASNPTSYSSSGFYFNWVVENKINYSKTFANRHNVNIVLVQSAQKETYKSNSGEATDYSNDFAPSLSNGTPLTSNSDISQWSLASYLARVQYNYKGKYLLSAAIRTDGSSRFGKNNRWGYFPSASAAWRISDEAFFRNVKALSFVDDIKLRASYGVTGNFRIGNYEHLELLGVDNYIIGSDGGSKANGYKPVSIQKDDLRWEKTKMFNLGFDMQLWRGLVGFNLDYYNSMTTDMLLEVTVPHVTGHSTALTNIGKVQNRGLELQITSQYRFNDNLSYSFSANYARNKNIVRELDGQSDQMIKSGSVDHAWYITQVGGQIGSYYLLVQDGIFMNQDELDAYPHFDSTQPGDFRFVDVDGDGVLDLDKDRMVVGNYMPDFTYGFGGSVNYKWFDMGFYFQGVYGNEILNLNRRYIDNMEGNTNGTTLALQRWKSEDDPGNGQVNRANRKTKGYNSRISTWHIEDGSYLRLQDVTIGYTLPSAVSRKFHVEKLRLYFSGQNLLTFTDYGGYNPEVNNRPDNSETPGEDYGTYPLAKVYMFGINLTF